MQVLQVFGFALSLLTSPLLSAAPMAEAPRATLFAPGSNFKNVLFRFEKEVSFKEGKKGVVNRYLEPDGKIALEEKISYRVDGSLDSYWRMTHQTGEETRMERDGDKVIFRRTVGGKEEKDEEKWRPDIITTDQMPGYVQSHWDEIMSGKEINLRVLIPSRMETVGFSAEKLEKPGSVDSQKTTVIEMTPSSMIIRAFVDPILFHYDAGESRRLLMVDGRMSVKQKKADGTYTDAIGQLVFNYEPVEQKPAAMAPEVAAKKSKKK